MHHSHAVFLKDSFVVGLDPHYPTSSKAVPYTVSPMDFDEHTEHADHVTVNHWTTPTAYYRTGTQFCCLAELASHTGCEPKSPIGRHDLEQLCLSQSDSENSTISSS